MEKKGEGLFKLDQVGIVGDVRGSGAEVEDGFSCGALVAKGVDVGHDVVAEFLLVLVGGGKVDGVDVFF